MKFDYATVEQFAQSCCKLQRAAKGDLFATAHEMEKINEDVWSWPELWFPEFAKLTECSSSIRDINVDHFKKTFEVSR
jgi:hypothetical protein